MNESEAQEPMQPLLDAAAAKSAGTLLREAREAAGLHVGALAVSLKVPVRKLEALEADDLGQLPDAVFARALAATVCRTLKIDPEPVLARLPQLHRPPLQVGTQEAPVRLDSHGGGMRLRSIGGLPRPVVYLSALLLVGALVVALMPSLRIGGEPLPATQAPDGMAVRTIPHQLSAAPAALPAADGATARPGIDLPVTAAPAATDSAPAATDSASAATDSASAPVGQRAAPVVPAAAVGTTVATVAAVPATTAGGGAVAVFTTREPSWVQVVDAAGLVHLRKTMNGGETVSINGTLPLSVVIGRANAIELVVRGKPFDVQAVAKDNVARFQIK